MPPIHHLPQVRAGLTTLTHGLPAARRMILSAIACLRRLIVPAVQPDMCGVITTFGNSWNGYLKGRMVGKTKQSNGLSCELAMYALGRAGRVGPIALSDV